MKYFTGIQCSFNHYYYLQILIKREMEDHNPLMPLLLCGSNSPVTEFNREYNLNIRNLKKEFRILSLIT